ncbi:MAG: hypothetical protein FD180_5093 [Planctomycetota bacterium]|nr:MAG: hypothetical protein FD180_5093 [Planctomycetota bacterium]
MKHYWAAHRTFVLAAGGMLVVALALLLGGALPARTATSDALTEAERLRKMLKSSEGSALSSSSRRQLEGEVEALKARVAELDKVSNPPAAPAGADKVLYGNQLAALNAAIEKASSDQGIIIENEAQFPKNPEEDLPLFLTKIEIAKKVLGRAVTSGIQKIRSINATNQTDEFYSGDMLEGGAVKRTIVVFEVAGPMDSLARLLHSLQQRDSFVIVPRAKLWREKPDDPEATMKIAVGGVQVSDAKPDAKGGTEPGGFIFGR